MTDLLVFVIHVTVKKSLLYIIPIAPTFWSLKRLNKSWRSGKSADRARQERPNAADATHIYAQAHTAQHTLMRKDVESSDSLAAFTLHIHTHLDTCLRQSNLLGEALPCKHVRVMRPLEFWKRNRGTSLQQVLRYSRSLARGVRCPRACAFFLQLSYEERSPGTNLDSACVACSFLLY